MDDHSIERAFHQAVAETYLLVQGDGIASLYRPGLALPATRGQEEDLEPPPLQAQAG